MPRPIAPGRHRAWLRAQGFRPIARIVPHGDHAHIERFAGAEQIIGGNYVVVQGGRAMLVGETSKDLVARMGNTVRWAGKRRDDPRAQIHAKVYRRGADILGRPEQMILVMGVAVTDREVVEKAIMERLSCPLNVRHASHGYAGIQALAAD